LIEPSTQRSKVSLGTNENTARNALAGSNGASLAPSIIQQIDNLVVTHQRLITPVGVIEGSRGLSEAKPPDIVAGYIVDPEGITADGRRNLRSPPRSRTSHANETGGVP